MTHASWKMAPSSIDDLLPGARLDEVINGFFVRNGFDPSVRDTCDSFARSRFSEADVAPATHQGYCSYTLTISGTHVLQFRPQAFRLDLAICEQAREIFPALVPETTYVDTIAGEGSRGAERGALRVYLVERSRGITLAEFRRRAKGKGDCAGEGDRMLYRRRLVEDLASFFATSYLHGRHPGESPKGQVGETLRCRLRILGNLPEHLKANYVDKIHLRIGSLESDAAWCLTHGDLVPGNIMVNPATGHLTGLIDWAEGEWLPFGVGLYGLEEVLGEEEEEDTKQDGGGEFEYYPEHHELRALFWRTFLEAAMQPRRAVVVLSPSGDWLGDVRLGRQLGILLWRGIAFDDGRLDRAVDAEKDGPELRKLEMFLDVPDCMNNGEFDVGGSRIAGTSTRTF